VRLESDASGGELHVRADVVGDDGRAQTFRRLSVHVAGPDGFSRDVPLDAVGAGRYAASVPLSRPGTYVSTAKDDVTNEAVGTTGAVLTIGDELRPTGSDRALLTRIASMTNGKVRYTLAGLFEDRGARRFAYTPLGTWLALTAAIAMLLAVASRRLGVPNVVAAIAARAKARREKDAQARAERAAEHARNAWLAQMEQERLNAALIARKQRAMSQQPNAGILSGIAANAPPHAAPRAPATPAGAPKAAQSPPQPPAERPLTAAERLALKRRERR
jgi:hypothetical protein